MPADRAGATVYIDDVTPVPGAHTGTLDTLGQCLFTTVSTRVALPQSYVRVTAAGFRPYEQHLEMPAGDADGNFQIRIGIPADPARPQDLILPDLTPIVTAPPSPPPPPPLPLRPNPAQQQTSIGMPTTRHTRAQLADIQTNLMLFVGDLPELTPHFIDQPNGPGYDARFHMRNRGGNGATPHGLVSGQWMWTVTLPLYPESLWPLLFKQAKEKFGCTHWVLHVVQPPTEWYHGVFSTAGVDWPAATMRAHAALLAAGLIPICAGVSTDQPLVTGFDGKSALVAMTDWDDFDTADCQIDAIAKAFPNALLYYERPGPDATRISPKPDACSTVQPNDGNGGAWLRSVQQRCPNFMGVLYEVNIWEGLQRCVDELKRCHPFWRDVQEVRFETNTYELFWQGGDPHAFIALEDQLQAACPWLRGYGSGGTPHPAPGDDPASGDLRPGDAFAFDLAVQHRGPAFTSWPATTAITRLELRTTGVHVEFSKKDGDGRWPDVIPHGWDGPLQYCLGMAMQIDGVWHVSAPIQFWHGLDASGGNVGDSAPRDNGIRGTVHGDWFYSGEWGALQRQPVAGEPVGFFVVAGNVRGVDDAVSVRERSNVVVVPFPDAHGAVFGKRT